MYCTMLCISAESVVQNARVCLLCSSLEQAPSHSILQALGSPRLAMISMYSAWALAIRRSNDKDKE